MLTVLQLVVNFIFWVLLFRVMDAYNIPDKGQWAMVIIIVVMFVVDMTFDAAKGHS